MVPIWLMFLFLGIASFAPVVVSLRPGWWMFYYYGALLVWWVFVSVAAMRWAARQDHKGERRLLRPVPRDTRTAEAAGPRADAVHPALAEERLIIVARDEVVLYHRIRRDHLGDDAVRVITDRRSTDRRLQLEVYIPDRRTDERRHYDVDPLLVTQGWAEVTVPKS